ncbi:MAG: hypothetical protein HY823_12115 [Acidobacteria bacterium]|nr:hypothetical protein [Acidobacteriota bacterium]
MSKKTLGSLADLARILEEASNPESELREDRKPTPKAGRKATAHTKTRIVDPKRKAWYERRLREQMEKEGGPGEGVAAGAAPAVKPSTTKAVATKVGGSLLDTLAAAKTAKPKSESKRPEAWKRKPGDPIF